MPIGISLSLMTVYGNPLLFVFFVMTFTIWRVSSPFILLLDIKKEVDHGPMSDVKDSSDVFERARKALREEILANPERIKKDLEEMRKKSTGENTVKDYLDYFNKNSNIEDCDHTYRNAGILQGNAMKICTKCHDYREAKDYGRPNQQK